MPERLGAAEAAVTARLMWWTLFERVAGLAGLLPPVATACAAALPFPSPVSTQKHPES